LICVIETHINAKLYYILHREAHTPLLDYFSLGNMGVFPFLFSILLSLETYLNRKNVNKSCGLIIVACG